jgi:hypothetical protein
MHTKIGRNEQDDHPDDFRRFRISGNIRSIITEETLRVRIHRIKKKFNSMCTK